MRLWHKDLIPVLPRQQLLGQWRECCLIAKLIAEKGTPNHILVNKILDYPLEDFFSYGMGVAAELFKRGCKVTQKSMMDFTNNIGAHDVTALIYVPREEVFFDWHNPRYLTQCYYNLQEKYDCGGISREEWEPISRLMNSIDALWLFHA